MTHPIKVDFHTHSTASPDGGITAEQYQVLLQNGKLDFIAITDHDRIDFALAMHKHLGNKIIVGQEITTSHGELIGLYLHSAVPTGLSPYETALAIRSQGGLVYIPHPFETVRKGVTKETLNSIVDLVDIVEVHNGRAVFQNKGPQAAAWARMHNKPGAASSDAHGIKGLATTFTTLKEVPTKDNLCELLTTARVLTARPPLYSLLYPKLNRLRGKLK